MEFQTNRSLFLPKWVIWSSCRNVVWNPLLLVNNYLIFIAGDQDKEEKSKEFKFTDDTAMTRSVARSLVSNKGLNVRDMARR